MTFDDGLVVGRTHPSEFSSVRQLAVDGLAQRWGHYDASLNPDLESFDMHYSSACVMAARLHDEIVGCGILIKDSDRVARIVRMSVESAHQRRGIGSKLMEALLQHAREHSYERIVLETTATWDSAVSFYIRHGFIPGLQIQGDQHFERRLSEVRPKLHGVVTNAPVSSMGKRFELPQGKMPGGPIQFSR